MYHIYGTARFIVHSLSHDCVVVIDGYFTAILICAPSITPSLAWAPPVTVMSICVIVVVVVVVVDAYAV
jgi:hypothetical protein